MTTSDVRTAVLEALGRVAPGTDLASVDPDADLGDALDLDSMDLLRFAVALHAKLDVEIPERDYSRLRTIRGCIEYLTGVASKH